VFNTCLDYTRFQAFVRPPMALVDKAMSGLAARDDIIYYFPIVLIQTDRKCIQIVESIVVVWLHYIPSRLSDWIESNNCFRYMPRQ